MRASAIESTNTYRGLIHEHPRFLRSVRRRRTCFRIGATAEQFDQWVRPPDMAHPLGT
jgi:hypothetical protein